MLKGLKQAGFWLAGSIGAGIIGYWVGNAMPSVTKSFAAILGAQLVQDIAKACGSLPPSHLWAPVVFYGVVCLVSLGAGLVMYLKGRAAARPPESLQRSLWTKLVEEDALKYKSVKNTYYFSSGRKPDYWHTERSVINIGPAGSPSRQLVPVGNAYYSPPYAVKIEKLVGGQEKDGDFGHDNLYTFNVLLDSELFPGDPPATFSYDARPGNQCGDAPAWVGAPTGLPAEAVTIEIHFAADALPIGNRVWRCYWKGSRLELPQTQLPGRVLAPIPVNPDGSVQVTFNEQEIHELGGISYGLAWQWYKGAKIGETPRRRRR